MGQMRLKQGSGMLPFLAGEAVVVELALSTGNRCRLAANAKGFLTSWAIEPINQAQQHADAAAGPWRTLGGRGGRGRGGEEEEEEEGVILGPPSAETEKRCGSCAEQPRRPQRDQ